MNDCKNLVIELTTEDKTRRFCRFLSEHLKRGHFLALCGDLGAGKTTFTRALTKSLGCTTLATSPTFSLFQRYDGGRLPVFHADLYRLGSEDELYELGWDEVLEEYADGLVVVEWADKFQTAWPVDHLILQFSYGEELESRELNMEASGTKAESLLSTVAKEWL